MRNFVIAMLLGALPLAAAAQGVYKYTDKDGRVVYTDDPNAGGGTARPVEDTTTTISSPTGANDPERKLLEQAQKRDAALDRAVSDITAAYGSLREAEVRKEAGVEPVEGERQGRRYRPEYWQRQQALQRDVEVARARLNDALDRRNSLK